MSDAIYLVQGDGLVAMRPQPYDSERVLQELLERFPDLLAGEQFSERPLRWLLVKREAGVPDQAGGGDRWSLDHLYVDDNAVPTLVEVKRSSDTRIRREVVGQMLDYAANGVVYWPAGRLREDFESRCVREHRVPDDVFAERLGEEVDPDTFWSAVDRNLGAGLLRLVFVADEIPPELRRVIEFLNERMTPTDVIGVEVHQYVGDQGIKTLVPRVVGRTARANQNKPPVVRTVVQVDWDDYERGLAADRYALVRELFEQIKHVIEDRGLPWIPALRTGYISFMEGRTARVGIGLRLGPKPIEYWVRLPRDLPQLGPDVHDPYPQLNSHWDEHNKLRVWEIPSAAAMPEVAAAIDLALAHRGESVS